MHFLITSLILLLRLSQMYLTELIRDDKPNHGGASQGKPRGYERQKIIIQLEM
jgi:hypothetical protein